MSYVKYTITTPYQYYAGAIIIPKKCMMFNSSLPESLSKPVMSKFESNGALKLLKLWVKMWNRVRAAKICVKKNINPPDISTQHYYVAVPLSYQQPFIFLIFHFFTVNCNFMLDEIFFYIHYIINAQNIFSYYLQFLIIFIPIFLT